MSDRYEVREVKESGEYYNALVDKKSGRILGEDGGAPEDQCLTRDWKWVGVELNKQDAELDRLRAENERRKQAQEEMTESVEQMRSNLVAAVEDCNAALERAEAAEARVRELEEKLRGIGKRVVEFTGVLVQACGGEGDAFHPNDVPSLVEDCLFLASDNGAPSATPTRARANGEPHTSDLYLAAQHVFLSSVCWEAQHHDGADCSARPDQEGGPCGMCCLGMAVDAELARRLHGDGRDE